jgi:uncharacterized membrane protein YidH (DUF202 family)
MEGMDPFATTGFSLQSIVQLVFLILLGVYLLFTIILYYHWREYGIDKKVTSYTLITYFTTTVPLLLIMGILLLVL